MKFNTYILLIQSIFSLIKLKNMKVNFKEKIFRLPKIQFENFKYEILKKENLLIKNFIYEGKPIKENITFTKLL